MRRTGCGLEGRWFAGESELSGAGRSTRDFVDVAVGEDVSDCTSATLNEDVGWSFESDEELSVSTSHT